MSGPILITVANLLCKTRNRCGGGEIGAPLTKHADITNESDQFALPQRSRPQAGGESNPKTACANTVSGYDPMSGAQAATSNPLEGRSESDCFSPDLTKAKTMPSSQRKERCDTGNPQ
jgi:hypothetical protein